MYEKGQSAPLNKKEAEIYKVKLKKIMSPSQIEKASEMTKDQSLKTSNSKQTKACTHQPSF